jgi:hypothetical protein
VKGSRHVDSPGPGLANWWLSGSVCFEPPPEPAPRPSDASAPPATTLPEERELLTLKQLVAYSALSERTLRDYINAPLRALPCYRIGVKVLVRKSEFDAWMLQHRQVGPAGLDRVVDSVIGPSKRRR